MATIFPSITGGGLTRAAEAILLAELRKKEDVQKAEALALEGRRVGVSERGAASEEERNVISREQLDLSGRRVDLETTAHALNQFEAIVSMSPPGQTLGEHGAAIINLFGQAFNVDDPASFSELVLTPETMATLFDTAGREFMGSEEGQALIAPGVRAGMGLEANVDVEAAATSDAQLRMTINQGILRNSEFVEEAVLRAIGREQEVTVRIPSGVEGEPDEQITFATEAAARIYAGWRMAREDFGYQISLEGIEDQSQFLLDIREAVAEAGHAVSDTTLTGTILPLFNRFVDPDNLDAEVELAAFLHSDAEEGEKLALKYLLGSIAIGDDAFLRNLPPELQQFYAVGEALSNMLGDDRAAEILPGLTEALGPDAISQLTQSRFLRNFQLGVSGDPATPIDPNDRSFGLGLANAPFALRLRAARDHLAAGESLEELLTDPDMKPDVAEALGLELPSSGTVTTAIPVGGYDILSVPAAAKADAQSVNRLLRRIDSVTDPRARENIQKAINRLSARIRREMEGA